MDIALNYQKTIDNYILSSVYWMLDNLVLSLDFIVSDIYRIYHTNIYGSTNFLSLLTKDVNNPCISDNPSKSNAKKTTLFGRSDTNFNIHLIS